MDNLEFCLRGLRERVCVALGFISLPDIWTRGLEPWKTSNTGNAGENIPGQGKTLPFASFAKSECKTSLAGGYFWEEHPLFLAVFPQPPSTPRGGRGSSRLTSAWRPSARRSRSCARSGKGCSRGSWPSSSTTVMSMGSPWRMITSEGCPQPALPSPGTAGQEKAGFFPNAKHFPPRHPRLSLWPGGCS